ncbi:MAG: 50S ribosomal protein L25 [Deltaproteobacteria bacterium]|jgi:large subunit ribosomal protein L25|nr:50S ribosomal protein L25 [Deltaproteobacteria bacterium]MBW2535443.1 50S ribosomal protein L25 [Deltaproteobacteria bacterium]
MEIVTLEAKTRTTAGKGPSRQLRRDGFIPSVAYKRGEPTQSIAVPRDDLRRILLSEHGKNSLIDLKVDGGEALAVMVKAYTIHPVTRRIVHADFMQVDRDKPVQVEVPFRRVGRSKGEAEGGTLLQTVRSLRVRCLPTNVPPALEADSTELEIDDVLRVQDLKLIEGIEVLHPPEQKLIVVQPPRVEETPAEAEGAEGAEGEEGEKPADGAEGEAAKSAEGGDAKADEKKKD